MAASSAASAVAELASAAAELARERAERAEMAAAGLQSFIAQRHFVGSVQVPQAGPVMTWQAAYELRHDDLTLAHQAMRGVRRHLRAGRPRWALAMLDEELGSSDEEPADEEPPDDLEEPAVEAAVDMEQLLEAVQLPMARPTAPQAFTGRFYRLDAQQPAPQPVQRCARCASTRNLELLLPTGRWANVPMDQRLFCDACIDAAE